MKKVFVLLFIVLFGIVLPYSCDNKLTKEYDKAISNADMLFDKNEYNDAKTYYEKALKLKPDQKYPAQKIEEIKEINRILELQKIDNQYNKELQLADSLFNENNFEEAKFAYIRADKIKPDETYPIEMIKKIQDLQLEAQIQEEEKNNPYYIIVGSFQIESNAFNLQTELISKGFDSRILEGINDFNRVTLTSHPDIHVAYNNLPNAFEQFNEDAWVCHQK